jgi:hypothetical protein
MVCFWPLPEVQGVKPPPDGGYPNGNTAEGQDALLNLTSGAYNTAVGWFSLRSNTAGQFNTAIGAGALFADLGDPSTAAGTQNTAIGAGALLSNTSGALNTANGAFALFSNTTGNGNTAVGDAALFHNINGGANVAVGPPSTLANNTSGSANTAIGQALNNNTTGSFNVAVGIDAGLNVITADNVTCIGAEVLGDNVSETTWIGNIYGVTTQSGTTAPVIVSDTGQLGTLVSSERFKKDIASMETASEAILSLRPVTFHYKSDSKGTPQFGLIAEEVAKVNPALVLPDKKGKPYSVRYDQVNAMLLNEFLKEHRKVAEQEATITQLKAELRATATRQQKQIEALTAGLQKVSAQLELSKSAPQTVLNNQ